MKKISLFFVCILLVFMFASCSTASEIASDNDMDDIVPKNDVAEQSVEVGETVKFGTYEQDNIKDNGEEDIEWEVLCIDNGRALLLSKDIILPHEFNPNEFSVTWKDCTLRAWLNSSFYEDAFSKDEREKIATVELSTESVQQISLKTHDYTAEPLPSCNTEDKVFILSVEELQEFFPAEKDRIAEPTPYVILNSDDASIYWTRTPGRAVGSQRIVDKDGSYELGGAGNNGVGGVRPAIWIVIDSSVMSDSSVVSEYSVINNDELTDEVVDNKTDVKEPNEDQADAQTAEPDIFEGSVELIINDSKDDTVNSINVFPKCRDRGYSAFAHIKVNTDIDNPCMRVVIEKQWGSDDEVKEDFRVESDEMKPMYANKWQEKSFSVSASNLYFYRVTVYYGDSGEALATKTIYTPYEELHYGEDDIPVEPPAFHPYNGLNELDMPVYEACHLPLTDFANAAHYTSVIYMSAWGTQDKMLVFAEFKNSSTSDAYWFAINNNNYEVYSDLDDVPVSDRSDDSLFHDIDYYYVEQAITNEISQLG